MNKEQLLQQLAKAIVAFDIEYAANNPSYLKVYIKYIQMLQRKLKKL